MCTEKHDCLKGVHPSLIPEKCYKCGFVAAELKTTNPPVPQVCSKVLLNDETCRSLMIIAFKQGYETGHDDTVESAYTDAEQRGKDWLADAIEDGTFYGI